MVYIYQGYTVVYFLSISYKKKVLVSIHFTNFDKSKSISPEIINVRNCHFDYITGYLAKSKNDENI